MERITKSIRLAAIAIALLAAPAAWTSIAWDGTLTNPHFMQNGVVLVYTSGNRPSIPACGAGQPTRFALDGSTAQGKTQVAGLLAAYAAGKQVVIVGTDTCSVYSDSETISYFYIVG
jgi:hypothetical protein